MTFYREARYNVIKVDDANKALNTDEFEAMHKVFLKLDAYRATQGKQPLVCCVVESDWPEYEPTWAAIEQRTKREATDAKFKEMFGIDLFDCYGYFYIVECLHGRFLITSDARSVNKLTKYTGFNFRMLACADNECTIDPNQKHTTNWTTQFNRAVRVDVLAEYEDMQEVYEALSEPLSEESNCSK